MAIRSGIGIGGAQVIDTRDIMSASARQIAQQQKAQALQAEREAKSAEKYNEELADLMASVKTEGARDIDVPDITDAYNQIKEYYSQSAKLKDSDKPLFRAELKNKINGLNEFAQRSNKFSKDLFAMSSDIAKNEWDYDPASVAELNKMSQTTLKQLGANAVIDPMRFKRLPNFGLIDTIIDKTYKLGEENAKFAGERFDKGKRFNVKRIDPAVIQNNLIQQFTSSPEAIKAISSLYVRELGKQPTDQDLTNYIMDKYKTKHGFDYVGEAKDLERPRAAAKLDNDDVFAGWIKGAFTKNNAESIKNLNSVSGQKVTITDKKDGTFIVEYKPIIDVGKGGVPILIESPEPKTEIATNPGELAGFLRDAGVTGAGSKLISKVGGSYRSPTTVKAPATTKTTKGKTVTGKVDNKL